MPVESKAQARYMAWKAYGKGRNKKGGPSRKVAKEFLDKSRGKIRDLPERKSKNRKIKRSKSRRS